MWVSQPGVTGEVNEPERVPDGRPRATQSLCQVGKSGESHVRRSLTRRDGRLYRQSDQLLNGCDGL